MTLIKPVPSRDRILLAAETLLRQGRDSFSMRELAEVAGVSFATPFNRFGSKGGLMRALSDARIARMDAHLDAAARPDDAAGRVRLAIEIAVAVMLEEPVLNRAVMGALGAPADDGGAVLARSAAFWARALGCGPDEALPRQLAFSFRGALSFWSAGELPDDRLRDEATGAALALLRGAVETRGSVLS